MLDLCINWRPEDGATAAQRLADQIEAKLHGILVVRNKWPSPPSGSSVEAIEDSLRICRVMVAVIGARWTEGLSNPDDSVRLTLAVAEA